MDRQTIQNCFEEAASEICMMYCADATCLPEKAIDWMVDHFIEYYRDEDPTRIPDNTDVIRWTCNYIQEH